MAASLPGDAAATTSYPAMCSMTTNLVKSHDINVTPFIDVMLVLLIIFMVAAPLSTVDLPVDLPTSTAIPQKKPDKPLYLTIKSDLSLALGEDPVKRAISFAPSTPPPKRATIAVFSCAPTAPFLMAN